MLCRNSEIFNHHAKWNNFLLLSELLLTWGLKKGAMRNMCYSYSSLIFCPIRKENCLQSYLSSSFHRHLIGWVIKKKEEQFKKPLPHYAPRFTQLLALDHFTAMSSYFLGKRELLDFGKHICPWWLSEHGFPSTLSKSTQLPFKSSFVKHILMPPSHSACLPSCNIEGLQPGKHTTIVWKAYAI